MAHLPGSRLVAFLLTLVVLSLVLPALTTQPASAVSGAIRTLGSPDVCKKTQLALGDDNSSAAVALPFTINFFGRSFSQLYVNNNGNVTFDEAMGTYTPFPLVGTSRQIIAPFFGDVDTRNQPNSPPDGVFYSYGFSDAVDIDGVLRKVFCVDWLNVGYYNQHYDKRNSFQLLIIERADVGAGNFDIEFNYDKINWETGDASGGVGGLGGSSARAGYSNGGTASYEIRGSAVNGALLDSNTATGLVHRSHNSTQLGRFTFPVRNTITATPANASAVYGERSVTLTTTVTVAGSPTVISEGDVTFTVKRADGTTVGTATSGAVSAGQASATFPLAGVGATNANGSTPATYAVSARYNGTSTYNPSDSPGNGTLSVAKADTATTADAKTIVYGQPLTLSAGVVGVSPSTAMVNEGVGHLAVIDGAFSVGSDAPVIRGVVTLDFQALSLPPRPVGTHTYTAIYLPNGNYNLSPRSSATITVTQAGTTTVATPATARYGDASVTLSANVTANAPSVAPVSAGVVTFSVKDAQGLAVGTPVTATPSNGLATATFALPAGSPPGSYSFRADYAGTTDLGASGATGGLQIETALTTTTPSPAAIRVLFGTASIDVSATVTSPGGTPAGAVTFAIRGTTVSSTVTLGATGAAAARLSLSGVSAGAHTIDVAFSGSPNFATSAAVVPLTLEVVATTTVVEDASAPSGAASVSLRATVSNTDPVSGGVVTFTVAKADGTVVGTPVDAPVVAGAATAQYALPAGTPEGTYVIKARYGGSPSFRPSDAAPARLTIFAGVAGVATCGGTAQPGAKVQLYSGGTLIATAAADASGRYSFANVLPGSYTVVVNDGVCGGSAVTVSGTGTPTQVTIAPPIDLNNHSWLTAFELRLNSTASVEEHIFKQGQSAWFWFDVTPQSKVILRLTNLATNYDLTLYKDIRQAFQAITSSADLDRLSIEFANELGANELGANELGANELGANELGANELGANELGANELGANELGANELGANELGAALSSAVSRSLIAFSSRGGTSDEIIVRNVWNNTGRFYIRVRGRDGAFSLARPFRLDVNLLAGSCGTVGPVTATPGGSVVLNGTASAPFRTVILTDLARMSGAPSLTAALELPAVQTLRDRLLTLAARPEVQGVVVDVGGDARVAAANAQAQGSPLCPFAKNVVADEIKRIVDGYRSPLEYVVIVGSDTVIPFFRYPDKAAIANEDQYYPSVLENTSSQASLRLNYVLSDDRYGSRFDVSRGDHTFPITDLAVGRLVETPAEATAVLDAYLATADGVVPLTANALVTGYDFLEKDARAVSAELALGTARPVDELIHTRGTPLATAWSAGQLAAALEQRRELVFLNGHMSQGSALAADFVTRYLAGQYAASAVDGRNTIIMGVGCHLGYNTVDEHGLPLTPAPDWPQAFARKGATLVASTGYAYGDSDIIDFGGRLYLELAKELRAQTPSGRVAIGTALLRAKQAYLASITRMSGTHEKQLLETTLFGLPHLSLNLPGQRLARVVDPSIVGATTPLDATLGLSYADTGSLSFGLTTRAVPLRDVATGALLDPTATYLAGANGSVANPGEPILPLELRNVSADTPLRGVGFRGGAYVDSLGVRPLASAPATEFSGVHPLFVSDFLYPVRPWSVNYFDAVRGGATRLAITPTQYVSSAPGSSTGTRRTFGSMSFRLFYSGNTSASALIAAPVVTGVTTTVLPDGSVRFDVTVSGEPTAGVAQAWITWTATTGAQREWRSIDLARADAADFTRWTATVPSATFGVPLADVRFIVQAVNGVGLVGLDTAHGRFHVPGAAAATLAAPKASATLAFTSGVPASGAYRSRVTLSAQLTSSGQVGSVPVTFSLGGQRAVGVTDGTGLATVTLRVNEDAGDSLLSASIDETEQRLGAATTPFTFRVDKAPTAVTLAPATLDGVYSDPGAFVATLRRAADGVRLDQQTVFFVVTPTCATPPCAGPSYETSDITDLHGRARLAAVPLPAGSYTVRAFFLGAIPLSSGTYTPASGVYTGSSASASLTQSAETATVVYGGGTIVAVGGALELAATVTQDADGSPGDIARAQVRYEVKDSTGAIVTTPSGPAVRTVGVNAQGIAAPASIAGLAVGVYTVETSVVGGFYATATPSAALLAVFDPNGSTAGGGHIMTTADAATVGLPAGEKASFAFQLRFQAGAGNVPSGHLRFDVRDSRGTRQRFEATSFDWLVTTFPDAQFQGSGTINGTGSFRFRVIIRDLGAGQSGSTGANTGQVDTFEIRIWDPNAAAPTSFDAPTYKASGTLSGGNITIPR